MIELKRDDAGYAHIVALSGGKDSTAMALRLAEIEPDTPYTYVCTPTGDEFPEMFEHWRRLGERLGSRLLPITGSTLKTICEQEKALPNWHMRFCTKLLKINPFKTFLLGAIPAVSYVGLRADEEDRAGVDWSPSHYGGSAKLSAPGAVEQRYPLREWVWGIADVLDYLNAQGIEIPPRTDCVRCFYQTLGEWWKLWSYHRELYADAEAMEAKFGHTFRSPSRDSWPASLAELRRKFEAGQVPRNANQLDLFRRATCRVCTL